MNDLTAKNLKTALWETLNAVKDGKMEPGQGDAIASQARELGRLAQEKGLVLYAYQNRRWDSDFLALKCLLTIPSSSPQYLGDITEFESHFDRYRTTLKGTWRDEALPAAGQTYDLAPHLIDQALVLFGRPQRLTAFIQNMRGIGNSKVDDSFTIFFHYDANEYRPCPLTAILRSHVLSVRSPQLRFIVRGTKGTFTKHGVDVQEDQLKVLSTPSAILGQSYGKEPENIWGTVENISENSSVVTRASWPSINAGCYIELFQNLGDVIRGEATPHIKWEEAVAVVELIELAHESSRKAATIVVPNTT